MSDSHIPGSGSYFLESKNTTNKSGNSWRTRRYLCHRNEIRFEVFRRDAGICAKCGLNTLDLHQALTNVQQKCDDLAPGWWPLVFRSFKAAVGRVASRYPQSLWDANMIIPQSKGGRLLLENFETLCLVCHRKETNRLIYGKES